LYNDEEHFIARPYDLAVKKANLMLDNMLASQIKQGKGTTTKSETYLDRLRSNCDELFIIAYQLIITKCKHNEHGHCLYEPRPMVSPDLRCAGCDKVQVDKGNNKG
jgi:hypothetical protein